MEYITLGFLLDNCIIDKYEIIKLIDYKSKNFYYTSSDYVSILTEGTYINTKVSSEHFIDNNKDKVVLSISTGPDGGLVLSLNEICFKE